MSKLILQCQDLGKTYQDGTLKVKVLQHLNFELYAGESVAIVGSSGSGKSTLLHLLGGLDLLFLGSINLMGHNLQTLNQQTLGHLRNRYLGFVYQFHHLLPEFSALENVMMPLLIGKQNRNQAAQRASEILAQVGLTRRLMHRPSELSGGERQRVAIARALVTQPACVLADEPTGNLDHKNAHNVLELMLELKAQSNTSVVIVTHDDKLAKKFDRVLVMQNGALHGTAANRMHYG